jgi:hypothetical protein
MTEGSKQSGSNDLDLPESDRTEFPLCTGLSQSRGYLLFTGGLSNGLGESLAAIGRALIKQSPNPKPED